MAAQTMPLQIDGEHSIAFEKRCQSSETQRIIEPAMDCKHKRVRRVTPKESSISQPVHLKPNLIGMTYQNKNPSGS